MTFVDSDKTLIPFPCTFRLKKLQNVSIVSAWSATAGFYDRAILLSFSIIKIDRWPLIRFICFHTQNPWILYHRATPKKPPRSIVIYFKFWWKWIFQPRVVCSSRLNAKNRIEIYGPSTCTTERLPTLKESRSQPWNIVEDRWSLKEMAKWILLPERVSIPTHKPSLVAINWKFNTPTPK